MTRSVMIDLLLLIAPVLMLAIYGMALVRRKVVSRLVVRGFLVMAMMINALVAGARLAEGERWAAVINIVCVVFLAWVLWFHIHRLRQIDATARLIMASLAPRPEGVTVVRADGTRQPCELLYRGLDDNGIHQWLVTGMVLQPGDGLYAEVMPGMTGIEYQMSPPDEGMPC